MILGNARGESQPRLPKSRRFVALRKSKGGGQPAFRECVCFFACVCDKRVSQTSEVLETSEV